MRQAAFFLILLVSAVVRAAEPQQLEQKVVRISAYDANGRAVGTSLGFVYDPYTVVCSYRNAQHATMIRIELEEEKSETNQLIAYSELFDVAILKTGEELTETAHLGSADLLSSGASLQYLARINGEWLPRAGTLLRFEDTGDSSEKMILQGGLAEGEKFEPGPLFDDSGRIVGWRITPGAAISMDTIHNLVVSRSATVPLAEMNRTGPVWKYHNVLVDEREVRLPDPGPTQIWKGPQSFPFEVVLPASWETQKLSESDRYLLRATDRESGFCAEIRVLYHYQSDDLMAGIEKAETLIFTDVTRSDLTPYSADEFTALQATYEHPDELFAVQALYTISGGRFYVVSLSFPKKFTRELQILIDQIFSSFRLH